MFKELLTENKLDDLLKKYNIKKIIRNKEIELTNDRLTFIHKNNNLTLITNLVKLTLTSYDVHLINDLSQELNKYKTLDLIDG